VSEMKSRRFMVGVSALDESMWVDLLQ